jgi:hypothetical protein
MNKELFLQYVRFPELLDDRSLAGIEGILQEYPFFQTARLLHIKNLHNQGSLGFEKTLRLAAVFIPDRSRLFYLLDHRALFPETELVNVISEVEAESEEIIDFSRLNEATPLVQIQPEEPIKNEKPDTLEDIILSGMAGSVPFFQVDDKVDLDSFKKAFKMKPIVTAEPEKKPRHIGLIDDFILKQPRIAPPQETKMPQPDISIPSTLENQDLITDTLAKIYIKQGLYEKALLAYEKLSLKYPEKNIYFAGQIKMIKKYINNQ